MIALHLDNISFAYVADTVFSGLSWEVHDQGCVGLVGPNGCGKSTLLRLMAGQLTPESGFANRAGGVSVGYLPQEPDFSLGHTVWQEALTASQGLQQVNGELNRVEEELADPDVYHDATRLEQALNEQARLLDRFAELGGPAYEGRVRSTLLDLGFGAEEISLPVEVLSGGQKKLVGLAKLLITQPDLLLLDEPDNHLDLAGKALLERLINGYGGGVIIVSHDRYLLDMVADEIVELEDGRLHRYVGNYSEYVFEKQAKLLRQQQLFQAQSKEIARLEEAAKRLLIWGRTYDNPKLIRRAQNIERRLQRIDRIDRPVLEPRRMGLELQGWRGSNKVLEILDLDKGYPATAKGESESWIFVGLNLLIWRGERVGLVGPNGAGKSLLFRLIRQEEAVDGGEIKIGPSVEIGYYAQEHETLDYSRTLMDTVRRAHPFDESSAVSFLGKFLFTYEQARSRVSTLSGGERSRLQLALLTLTRANFLLLDEPTNNLDIPSAEVLEEALADFEGTVLVISHDRYFLDRVADRIVAIEDGSLRETLGGYSDYAGAAKAT